MRVRVRRLREDVPRGAFLDDLARVHDGDAVAGLGDDPEVVGDQEQRGAEVLAQVGEDAQDLRLDDDVQRGRRLVRDEELRAQDEGKRDHDPLPHAARELVRVLTKSSRRNAHAPERLERALPNLTVAESGLVLLERLAEVILDPHERVQTRHRLLEDEPELRPAVVAQLLRRHREEVLPAVLHLAVRRCTLRQEAQDAPSERRLPATRLADQPEDLARADVERDSVDRSHRAAQGPVVDAQVAHRDNWRRSHRRSASG